MAERRGWGHSTYEEAVALAMAAGVHNLILTHHDPSRSDAEVEKIIEAARQLAAASDNPALYRRRPGRGLLPAALEVEFRVFEF